MQSPSVPNMLLLCNRPAPGANAATIADHLDAFQLMPEWLVHELSMIGDIPETIDLDRFTAIGIHYTLHLSDPNDHFLSKAAVARLSRFRGLKCAWLHDEYRRVDAVANLLATIGVDVIFSLAEGQTLQAIYPQKTLPTARLETVLAGYVAQSWLSHSVPPLASRAVDVGYRARRMPYWLGALAQEKIDIGLKFVEHASTSGLALDISVEEHDRLYGEAWEAYLRNCKTVLCVESGASIVDFSGEIENSVEQAVRLDKHLTFAAASERFFKDIDWRNVINPVSPRIFEAAATGAAMIAFEGRYSEIMRPWVHYIPLKKDFSNIADVINAVRDDQRVKQIASNAYNDIATNPEFSYAAFAQKCSVVLHEELARRGYPKLVARPYGSAEFKKALHRSPRYWVRRHVVFRLQKMIVSSPLRGPLIRLWYQLPPSVRKIIKPALKIIGR